jgi:hypothetical protein
MKIELILDKEFGKPIWYEIRIDGRYVSGSYTYETAKQEYDNFIKNPDLMQVKKEVLESQEIFVTSQSNQTT